MLTYRIMHYSLVAAYDGAVGENIVSRPARFSRKPLHRRRVVTVRHEAYVLTVMLRGVYKAVFLSDAPCLGLCEAA